MQSFVIAQETYVNKKILLQKLDARTKTEPHPDCLLKHWEGRRFHISWNKARIIQVWNTKTRIWLRWKVYRRKFLSYGLLPINCISNKSSFAFYGHIIGTPWTQTLRLMQTTVPRNKSCVIVLYVQRELLYTDKSPCIQCSGPWDLGHLTWRKRKGAAIIYSSKPI